jgi:hypothetical protein
MAVETASFVLNIVHQILTSVDSLKGHPHAAAVLQPSLCTAMTMDPPLEMSMRSLLLLLAYMPAPAAAVALKQSRC